MATLYHMLHQNDLEPWYEALGVGISRHDTVPLVTNAPVVPTLPPMPIAGGQADAQTFDLRSYPGTPEAAVYELLRSGASHAWLQSAATGTYIHTSQQMAQTRLSIADLVLTYRAPVALAYHADCDHIHASGQCTRTQPVNSIYSEPVAYGNNTKQSDKQQGYWK